MDLGSIADFIWGPAGDKVKAGLSNTASTNPADYKVPLPHEQQLNDLVNRGLGRLDSQQAPQDQFRQMQMQQARQLQAIAAGRQKGAGELAAERQAQNALAAQQALASMRGAGGAGQLAAARQSAAIGSTAAGMGQRSALQDQSAAQQLLAGVTGQGRSGDITNASAANDAYMAYIRALLGMDQTQLGAQTAAMQAALGKPSEWGQVLAAAGPIIGAMASDEALKTEIRPAGHEIDAMLDALRPYNYRYKDEARWGAGPRAGILAQDLERSAAGRATVMDTPEGKLVDVNKALSAALAGAARLNERLRKLEHIAGVQEPGGRMHEMHEMREGSSSARPPALPIARVITIGTR